MVAEHQRMLNPTNMVGLQSFPRESRGRGKIVFVVVVVVVVFRMKVYVISDS